MSYEKTTWNNGAAPALNANNLNKIEQGIKDAHDDLIEHKAQDATTTQKGHIQLATGAEVTIGTNATKAVTPSTLKAELDKKANTSHTHTKDQVGLGNVENVQQATKTEFNILNHGVSQISDTGQITEIFTVGLAKDTVATGNMTANYGLVFTVTNDVVLKSFHIERANTTQMGWGIAPYVAGKALTAYTAEESLVRTTQNGTVGINKIETNVAIPASASPYILYRYSGSSMKYNNGSFFPMSTDSSLTLNHATNSSGNSVTTASYVFYELEFETKKDGKVVKLNHDNGKKYTLHLDNDGLYLREV